MEKSYKRENIDTKICTKCNKELTLECFSKNIASKDGLQQYCKACRKVIYNNNREYHSQYKKQYIKNNRHDDLYIVYDEYENVQYVGSTIQNINFRMYCHKNSSLKSSEYITKIINGEELGKILFIRLDEYNLTETELRYIEQCFIDSLEPTLNINSACTNIDKIDRLAYIDKLAVHLIDSFNDIAMTYIDRCYTLELDNWLELGMAM